MNNRKFQLWLATAAVMNLGVASQALASGYEKSIVWGGRSAGVAGIATPYIQGSEALYFNPAGLVSDKVGQDISFNISPVWSQFKAPINNQNEEASSVRSITTPFSVIYGNTLNESLGFGAGVYVSGGSKASYEGLTFPEVQGNPIAKVDLSIIEAAAGVGYKLTPELKIGGSYRVVMANATFAFINRAIVAAPSTKGLLNVTLDDLKDTNWTGFKLGAQYKLGEKTLLGLTYRSEVNFEASGTMGGNVHTPAGVLALDQTSATAKTTFPMAVTFGALHDLNEDWRLLGEYVWTQYSRVGEINVTGDIKRSGATVRSNPVLTQNWQDQHNVRLAGEWKSLPYPLRFGYIWTSQVTASEWARATFTPPGQAHTFTVGTGHAFDVMGMPLQADVAGEYTFVTGDANGKPAGDFSVVNTDPQADIRSGTHKVDAWALHFGLAYAF